jgi:CubicO group peptidase (beta-lactamase class C family)
MSFRLGSRPLLFRFSILLGILVISNAGVHGQSDNTQQVFQREDEYFASQVETNSFRGGVLVGIDGKIVFEKTYGFAVEEWNLGNTLSTKFRIASLTKQFTAACILLLQERGRLSVHEPISRYLTDLPTAWQPITIHQLLTHTSGIPNYPADPQIAKLNRSGATPRELIAVVAGKPLEFKPGTGWAYSNTGYVLLGMIIEKISGVSYAEFLQSNIFQPLAMKNSGYDRAADILKERASGYEIKDGKVVNADFIDMTIPYAAGGIYSTVEDMYRWNEALAQNGKLLAGDSLTQMFTPYPEASYQGQHYAYGVVISERKFGKLLYYHGGGVQGFSSSIQRYPKEKVCIIVLSNLGTAKPWEMGDQVAAALFRLPLPATQ